MCASLEEIVYIMGSHGAKSRNVNDLSFLVIKSYLEYKLRWESRCGEKSCEPNKFSILGERLSQRKWRKK